MVKITPNCLECMMIEKVESVTGCGLLVHFKCINKFIRIYGNPELVVCNEFEERNY